MNRQHFANELKRTPAYQYAILACTLIGSASFLVGLFATSVPSVAFMVVGAAFLIGGLFIDRMYT